MASLHSLHSPLVGFVSLLFLVGNVGITVYSHVALSAEMMANIPYSVYADLASGTPEKENVEAINDDEASSAGSSSVFNATDYMSYCVDKGGSEWTSLPTASCGLADRVKFAQEGCKEELTTYQRNWGITCLSEGTVECVAEQAEGAGYSAACSLCLGGINTCGYTECFLKGCKCLGSVSDICDQCMEPLCDPTFVACSGFPGYARVVTASPTQTAAAPTSAPPVEVGLVDKFGVMWYSIPDEGQISFVNSISRAWEGGAYAIAVVVVVFSGFEPYFENVLMCIAWFVPMRVSTRQTLLHSMSWFGRWSLVDVFAVLVLVLGLQFELVGGTVTIKAESRIAVSVFAIQNMWALSQGEWMLHRHRMVSAHSNRPDSKKGKVLTVLAKRGPLALLTLFVLVLTVLSVMGPALSFQIADGTTSNDWGFSIYSIFSYVVDFPAVVCFLRAFLLPIVVCVGVLVEVAVRPLDSPITATRLRWWAVAAHFCALDVFLLAAVLIGSEYGQLIVSTVESVNPGYAMEVSSTFGWGLLLIVPTSLLQWLMVWVLNEVAEMGERAAESKQGKTLPSEKLRRKEVDLVTVAGKNADNGTKHVSDVAETAG